MIFWCSEKVKNTIWRNGSLLPSCNVHTPLQKLHTCQCNQGAVWEQPPTITGMEKFPTSMHLCVHKKHAQLVTFVREPEPVMPTRNSPLPEQMPRKREGGDAAVSLPWEHVQCAAPMSKVHVFCSFSWNSPLSEEVLLRSCGRHQRLPQILQMFSHTKAILGAHASQLCHFLVLAVTRVFWDIQGFCICAG